MKSRRLDLTSRPGNKHHNLTCTPTLTPPWLGWSHSAAPTLFSTTAWESQRDSKEFQEILGFRSQNHQNRADPSNGSGNPSNGSGICQTDPVIRQTDLIRSNGIIRSNVFNSVQTDPAGNQPGIRLTWINYIENVKQTMPFKRIRSPWQNHQGARNPSIKH